MEVNYICLNNLLSITLILINRIWEERIKKEFGDLFISIDLIKTENVCIYFV